MSKTQRYTNFFTCSLIMAKPDANKRKRKRTKNQGKGKNGDVGNDGSSSSAGRSSSSGAEKITNTSGMGLIDGTVPWMQTIAVADIKGSSEFGLKATLRNAKEKPFFQNMQPLHKYTVVTQDETLPFLCISSTLSFLSPPSFIPPPACVSLA